MVDSRCGLHCIGCGWKESHGCGGCIETNGNPFHGECPVAMCCQNKELVHCGNCPAIPCELLTEYSYDKEHGDNGERIAQCKEWALEEKILKRIYALGITEMKTVVGLNKLDGSYINLECKLPNGKTGRLLDDHKKYLGNQVCQTGTDKCYGIAADESQIAIYLYGCNGADAELIAWIRI